MSGIYIPGLNLPPKGKIKMLVLFDDGIVLDDYDGQNQWQAIEVPPHGRLVDADALHYSRVAIWHHDETVPMGGYVGGMNAVVMSAEIHNAPTIIPADKETD